MCEDIPDPENGDIEYSVDTTATFEVQTTATYSCDPGYSLQGGNMVRICVGTVESPVGMFDGEAPSCEREYLLLLIIIHVCNITDIQLYMHAHI